MTMSDAALFPQSERSRALDTKMAVLLAQTGVQALRDG